MATKHSPGSLPEVTGDRTDLDRRTSTSPPVVFHINYPSYQAVPFQVDRQISIVGLLAALSPIDKGSMWKRQEQSKIFSSVVSCTTSPGNAEDCLHVLPSDCIRLPWYTCTSECESKLCSKKLWEEWEDQEFNLSIIGCHAFWGLLCWHANETNSYLAKLSIDTASFERWELTSHSLTVLS